MKFILLLLLILFKCNAHGQNIITLNNHTNDEVTYTYCSGTLVVKGKLSTQAVLKREDKEQCHLRTLIVDGVTGNGFLSIDANYVDSIQIGSIRLRELEIKADSVHEIVSLAEQKEVIQSKFLLNNVGRVDLNSIYNSEELYIDVAGVVKELYLDSEYTNSLVIDGRGDGRLSYVELRDTRNSANPTTEPINVAIANVRLGRLKIATAKQVDSHAIEHLKAIYQIEDVKFDDRDQDIEVRINSTNSVFDFRGVSFSSPAISRFRVDIDDRLDQPVERLLLSELGHVKEIQIKGRYLPKNFFLDSVSAYAIDISADPISRGRFGSLSVKNLNIRRSLSSSNKKTLFFIADRNNTKDPNEVLSFYDVMISKGVIYEDGGKAEFPRLEAIKERQLKELSYRPLVDFVFGKAIYFVTGYGASLNAPFIFWALLNFIFFIYYLWVVIKKGTLSGIWNYMAIPIYTVIFSFTFGSPPHFIVKRIGGSIAGEQVLAAAKLQGTIVFLQITLLSIYLSQTTLP